VLVAVGMASTVWVCKASAVDAICVNIEALSTVGVEAGLPPPQADSPSRVRAIKRQDIFERRFIKLNLHFQQIWPIENGHGFIFFIITESGLFQ
jgi:hypothetical protein